MLQVAHLPQAAANGAPLCAMERRCLASVSSNGILLAAQILRFDGQWGRCDSMPHDVGGGLRLTLTGGQASLGNGCCQEYCACDAMCACGCSWSQR